MRLATFLADGVERWGVVVGDWLVEPARAQAALAAHAAIASSGPVAAPCFLAGPWPTSLVGFLTLDDAGMVALDRLAVAVERFATQTDATILPRSGYLVDAVELLAPVPRPRLCWGLVTNSPSFVRNKPGVGLVNLFPLGHQRPQGSVVGPDALVVMRHDNHLPSMAYNVELAVVIGRDGRHVPVERAMEHVAGYTVVDDVSGTHYFSTVPGNAGTGYSLPAQYTDWLYQATASWGGKKADTLSPMGPYLVTKDEVGDPYNLLMWTRQSGSTRDRSHSGAALLGVERVLAWYSSFASLHVGDVIHFGTMGVDGLPVTPQEVAAGTRLEVEIESVGVLSNPVVVADPGLWPDGRAPDLTRHPSWAVRELALRELDRPGSTDVASPDTWSVTTTRHLWTAFGNAAPADEADPDGLRRLAVPRFLNGPASALSAAPADGGSAVVLVPPRATDLVLSVELALVVRRLVSDALVSDAPQGAVDDLVLGYTPLVSLCDQSFQDVVAEPARAGERGIGAVYGRWPDGFNVVLPAPRAFEPLPERAHPDDWSGREMWLLVDGPALDVGAEARGSTAGYVAGPGTLLATISRMITLFPGDVVTLGATSARVRVTREQYARGLDVTAGIAGLGTLRARIGPET